MPREFHEGGRWSRLGAALMAGALSLGVMVAVGSLTLGVSGAAVPVALVAGTFSLNESGNLHATSKHGFTLNEQGSASGTIRGTIYVHLTIVSTSRVTAEVNIYPRGGSITGYGTASYERGKATATFYGSASINRGTGSYAHAHGSGLSFSGTIARYTDAVAVHVSGRVSD